MGLDEIKTRWSPLFADIAERGGMASFFPIPETGVALDAAPRDVAWLIGEVERLRADWSNPLLRAARAIGIRQTEPIPTQTMGDLADAIVAEVERLRGLMPTCGQCGKAYLERACGPTHAALAQPMLVPGEAQRWRVRAERAEAENERLRETLAQERAACVSRTALDAERAEVERLMAVERRVGRILALLDERTALLRHSDSERAEEYFRGRNVGELAGTEQAADALRAALAVGKGE